jgi:hypothetical protein
LASSVLLCVSLLGAISIVLKTPVIRVGGSRHPNHLLRANLKNELSIVSHRGGLFEGDPK